MKRGLILTLVAILVAGFSLRGRLLPQLESPPHYLGYVEGETTLISSPTGGRLVTRAPQRGDQVKRGALLFEIDPTAADAEVARAHAAVVEAEAQLENIRTGKREVELDVIRAQRREAEASLVYAQQDLERAKALLDRGNTPRSRYDQADSQVRQMKARVESLKAQEAANELGGRVRELEAAEARVKEARAQATQAESRRSDLAPKAPADALVDNTFYDVGEWVGAGQPVLSLLAPDKVKLRFFVPQDTIARATPGSTITFTCDGCAGPRKARITYVSPRAEFTPPVIYSDTARAKLVFLVEARPDGDIATLRPGLPVEVEPLAGGTS
jgi:HlyD family secretion protein